MASVGTEFCESCSKIHRNVQLGSRFVYFPSPSFYLIEDSSRLIRADCSGSTLRAKFKEDGFVLLRGVIPADVVVAAREAVLAEFYAKGSVLHIGDGFKQKDAYLQARCGVGCVPFMEGEQSKRPEVLACVEHPSLRAAIAAVLGESPEDVITFDYKWLRGVPRRRFTGAHMDHVYMSRGSSRLVTSWVPLGDAPIEMGSLAMCKGSHRLPAFQHMRDTYGSMDQEAVGMKGTGWFTEDPAEVQAATSASASRDSKAEPETGTETGTGPGTGTGTATDKREDTLEDTDNGTLSTSEGTEGEGHPATPVWVGGDYRAGDVIIFGMHTLHMSTANLTDKVRISCDVRWQPMNEPVDPRYMGAAAADVGSRAVAGLRAAHDELEGVVECISAGSEAEEGSTSSARESSSKVGAEDAKPTIQDMKVKWGFYRFDPSSGDAQWGPVVLPAKDYA